MPASTNSNHNRLFYYPHSLPQWLKTSHWSQNLCAMHGSLQFKCQTNCAGMYFITYKSLAAVEMGDHLATINMGQKLLGRAPFLWGQEAEPHLTQCRLGRKFFWASPPPFWGGGLGLHLTQCPLGWGLHPYQVASWCIQPFGHNRNGPKKLGSGLCLLLVSGAGSPSNTMWSGPRPTCVPSFILIRPTVWPVRFKKWLGKS